MLQSKCWGDTDGNYVCVEVLSGQMNTQKLKTAHIQSSWTHKLQSHSHTHTHTNATDTCRRFVYTEECVVEILEVNLLIKAASLVGSLYSTSVCLVLYGDRSRRSKVDEPR